MKTSTIALLAPALLLAAPAFAGPAVTVVETVQVADLDLSRPGDRAALESRVRHAVHAACGDASSADLAGANAVRRCRVDTTARARAQLDRAYAGATARAAAVARLDR